MTDDTVRLVRCDDGTTFEVETPPDADPWRTILATQDAVIDRVYDLGPVVSLVERRRLWTAGTGQHFEGMRVRWQA